MKDNVNPQHYKNGKVEAIEAIESAIVNKMGIEAACTANIIKYLWRYESKNGVEDVEKAKWYLEKLIKHLYEQIRKDQQSNESLASVSERGDENQKGFEEPSLQEQLRESFKHSGLCHACTFKDWVSDYEPSGGRVSYYYDFSRGEWRVHGKCVSLNCKRCDQSPTDRFCY